jgi:hypothetical protein
MMHRRRFLAAAVTSTLAVGTRLRAEYPGVGYRPYHRCLPDFLEELVAQAREVRDRRLAGIRTAEDVAACRAWVRETFWRLVGGMPERTPLNPRVAGSFERPGYRVERLVYESRPGFHIPANLYLPVEGTPPYPGVLFQMGHSLNGKAAAPYQRCCQGLAQLGFAVLGFDPMGQGERTYYPGPDGLTRLGSADEEHSRPGKQMLLVGDTCTRLQVWDAVRSLDVLASHPLVDSTRLASTGQSGGGTLTMLLAAVDDRLAAAAISCANTENYFCEGFLPPGATDDAEQNLLNSAAAGFDRWDLLYPLAPQPLLVLVSARDWFGTYSPRYLDDGWREFKRLRRAYEILGRPEQLSWVDTPMPHNLAYDMRVAIYAWFRRWLQPGLPPVSSEPETRIEEDRTLWVTESGNVVVSLGSATPLSLLPKPPASGSAGTGGLQRLLRLPAGSGMQPSFRILGERRSGALRLRAVEVHSEGPVWVPAWLFLPERPGRRLVVLEPPGRSQRWREDDLYQQLAGTGVAVCAPDLRWMGDLRPELPRGPLNSGSWHGEEDAWAWASLIVGRPLVGQRVQDLLTVLRAVAAEMEAGEDGVVLAARGWTTVPALLAAALEPAVKALYLAGGLVSFQSLLQEPDYDHPLANFLPGLLAVTDLPGIVRSILPRRVVLAGLQDPKGQTLASEEVEKVYGSGVEIRAEAAWDTGTLAALGG